MADDQIDTNTQSNPQAGNADQPAAATSTAQPGLTAEQVQKMIEEATQKAFNSGAAAARREEKAKAEKAKTTEPVKPASDPPTTQHTPQIDGWALSEAMSDFQLTKDQRKKIADLARKESPDNVEEFVAQWAGLFGAKPVQPTGARESTTQNNSPAQPQQAQTQQQAPNISSPAPTPDREFDTVFKALSEDAARDTWQAYVRRKGANPANPYDPRNRPAWREMRKRFEAALATASIQLGARRG